MREKKKNCNVNLTEHMNVVYGLGHFTCMGMCVYLFHQRIPTYCRHEIYGTYYGFSGIFPHIIAVTTDICDSIFAEDEKMK